MPRDMQELRENQPVYFQPMYRKKWKRAKVQSKFSDRSYVLECDDATTYRRNRVHIRPAYSNHDKQ